MADKPRTFEEVVEATDPAVRERIERAELYRDPAVENDDHIPDCKFPVYERKPPVRNLTSFSEALRSRKQIGY
jgi:hypothetical protein